eukprot:scaffold845_cov364-Prasinococcus_capsulatus_cf.AAC.17
MNRLHYEAPFGLCIQMSDANMSAQSAPSTQTCMHTIRESELMSSVGLRNDDLQKGSRRIPRDRKTQYFQDCPEWPPCGFLRRPLVYEPFAVVLSRQLRGEMRQVRAQVFRRQVLSGPVRGPLQIDIGLM